MLSKLTRLLGGGVPRASYMTPITFDLPVLQLRRRDRYEFLANNDFKTLEKKLKLFRRKMFVFNNLKQDPHAFLQYRYNDQGEL